MIDPYLVYVVASTNANYLFEAHPVRVGLNNYSLMLGSLESFSSNAFCVKEVFYIASLYLDPNYIQQVQSMFTRLLEMDDFEIETPIELVQVLGGHFPNKDTFIYYPKPEVM